MKKWKYPDGTLVLGDCLEYMASIPEKSVDLVFGSPPYEDARLYLEDGKDLGIARKTEEWVSWMREIFLASLRVCKGLVAFVVGHGKGTKTWTGAPALLIADLIRLDKVNLRNPSWYRRNGIMGGGGPDGFRSDLEFIICAGPRNLPWSDNTACGTPPKFEPGGQISHRNRSGERVSARLGHGDRRGIRNPTKIVGRSLSPSMQKAIRELVEKEGITKKEAAKRLGVGVRPLTNSDGAWKREEVEGGARVSSNVYVPPELANPGNVIDCKGGGGHAGSNIAHEGEAPFPEKLADRFVRSFCPPGGIVYDPFGGTGTTIAVAIQTGRNWIASDLRMSQINLMKRRVKQARIRKGFGE